MKKRAFVLVLAPLVLVGALLWTLATTLTRTERDLKTSLGSRADWSGWPNRGLPLRIYAGVSRPVLRSKPDFEKILTPQQVRDLARVIQLERRPRNEESLGDGKINGRGITFWLEPDTGSDATQNNGVPNSVQLEWGMAVEGDSEAARWSHYQLTPASRRAARRYLWKTYESELHRYFSPPN